MSHKDERERETPRNRVLVALHLPEICICSKGHRIPAPSHWVSAVIGTLGLVLLFLHGCPQGSMDSS